jgi:hypothetical protein
MSEYLSLGHMSVAKLPGRYIIPHYAVCNQSNGDLKIRVVFDASAISHDGTSLNGCLLQGPKLQQNIVDILTRFRLYKYAFTTDICKMYRQVMVAPEYRPLQHILWHASPRDQLIDSPPIFTKRGVLSLITRIFDPLGMFSPATFYAKHIMQRTWSNNLGWDDKLPSHIM